MSRFRLHILAAAVFAIAYVQFSRVNPRHESGVLPIDPPTPYIHYSPRASSIGTVLMIHGLDVSKEVTSLLCSAFADGGFDVYAIDLPGHGDSPIAFQTDLAEQAIRNAKVFIKPDAVAGHSLGAGLLLDLSESESFPALVLLSPPPVSVTSIRADRVLIATGDVDIPRIRSFVPIAADIANGKVETWMLPWGGHSAPLFNPRYIRRVVEWVGGHGNQIRTMRRIVWFALMFVSTVALGASLLRSQVVGAVETRISELIIRYVAACGIAFVLAHFVHLFAWLRFFATDYLIDFLFIAGGVAIVMARRERKVLLKTSTRGVLKAVTAAAFTIGVLGVIVCSQVLHMRLSDDRWWRFPFVAVASLPLFVADELTLREIRPRWKSDLVAVLTRGILLAFILTGVLTLNRESAFLVLIIPLIVVFWIALWFAAGTIRRDTQSPLAAAVFACLVQGWAFAAWFVTI